MEPTNWAPEHSDALRELVARGLSFSEIAAAINAKFRTAYTRNATLGRARRMGLAGPDRPSLPPSTQSAQLSRLCEIRSAKSNPTEFHRPVPAFERMEVAKLRCVEIEPRHLSLIELERRDCRYPYGGDVVLHARPSG
jgi:GcrA cell cycle regulator